MKLIENTKSERVCPCNFNAIYKEKQRFRFNLYLINTMEDFFYLILNISSIVCEAETHKSLFIETKIKNKQSYRKKIINIYFKWTIVNRTVVNRAVENRTIAL